MTSSDSPLKIYSRKQNTLASEVSFSGIGIHTGQCVYMRFIPAPENTGRIFRRTDLPGSPEIPASLDYVIDTNRSTSIGIGGVRIYTVEHVLAALAAYKVDNLYIEISNVEPPVASGGSIEFVEMIEKAGLLTQDAEQPIVQLKAPIYQSEGDIHLVALPYHEYRISYTLSYPDNPALKSQYRSFAIDPNSFKKELAPSRTFSLYKEVSALMDKGLIKGGSLANAVIIHDEVIFSKGGLFYDDEPVRHKMLDMVGDFSLLGFDLIAHFISIRSGHGPNFAFAKKIMEEINSENMV